MCHGRRRAFGRGHGFGPPFGLRRFGDRESWLERLEDYQRDLEQELADVADIIRRLKEEPRETAQV
jgi:hypothetical protein